MRMVVEFENREDIEGFLKTFFKEETNRVDMKNILSKPVKGYKSTRHVKKIQECPICNKFFRKVNLHIKTKHDPKFRGRFLKNLEVARANNPLLRGRYETA